MFPLARGPGAPRRLRKRVHDLGRQVKLMRVTRDMSQGELAQAAGVHPSLLSRIESGKQDFKLSSIEPVVEALGAELIVSLRKEGQIPGNPVDNEKRKETADVG